jgi:hypothetical protein
MERPISIDSCGVGNPCPASPTPAPNGGAFTPLPVDDCQWVAPIPVQGSGCLGEFELIETTSRGTCRMSELVSGDTILGFTSSGCTANQVVTQIEVTIQPSLQVIAGAKQVVCSTSHLFMTSHADSIKAEELTLGTKILDDQGGHVEVSQVVELGLRPVVNLVCEPDHTYSANGLLHHNKVSIISGELEL